MAIYTTKSELSYVWRVYFSLRKILLVVSLSCRVLSKILLSLCPTYGYKAYTEYHKLVGCV